MTNKTLNEQIKEMDEDYPILQASLREYPDNGVLQDQDVMYKVIKKQQEIIRLQAVFIEQAHEDLKQPSVLPASHTLHGSRIMTKKLMGE